MDIKDIIGDSGKQTDGVWVRYEETDIELLITYSGRDDVRKYVNTQQAKHRSKSRKGVLPAEIARAIALNSIVKFLLKGWKNVDIDGKAYEFNEQNARWLLERSSNLRDFIADEAANGSNFGIVTSEAELAAAADGEGEPESEDAGEASATKSGAAVATKVRKRS